MRVALKRYDFMARLVTQAAIQPDHRVLDLGCGSGLLALEIASACSSCTVIGLDADDAILHIARRNMKDAGQPIHFVHGSSYTMPFEDHYFDRILSSLLFHHLTTAHKRRTLVEVRRVLKPGGTLHIVDWGKPRHAMSRLAFFFVQILDGFDTTSDNVRGRIPQLMRDAGFSGVSETEQIATVAGTLSLYKGTNPC